MNKTKIIATIGPSSSSRETIKKLVEAGIDVVKVDFDSTNHNFCKDIVEKVNDINKELKTNIATMLDSKGYNVKVGSIQNDEAILEENTKIRIYMDKLVGDSTKFSVNNPSIFKNIKYDTIIKINNGHISLQVIDKGDDYLLCNVLMGGTIYSGANINILGLDGKESYISKHDYEDILFASNLGVDFLALSFVSGHEQILDINDILINLGNDHMQIIAKIENESGYDDIDEIIKVSDGVMVARGDLGIELPMERLPGIQKSIINKCHLAGKISIVATELMSSMEDSLLPTRAEVLDVANAVLDGTDAVMLSSETTIGKYPVETVNTVERIIESAERDVDYFSFMDKAIRTESKDITGILAHSVAYNSNLLNCKAIFAPTISGYTARKISRFRPNSPIIAATPNIDVARSLALNFGVFPVLISELKSFDKIIEVSKKLVGDVIELVPKDKIIITGGYPFKETKHTNFMKIEEI